MIDRTGEVWDIGPGFTRRWLVVSVGQFVQTGTYTLHPAVCLDDGTVDMLCEYQELPFERIDGVRFVGRAGE